MKRRGGKEERTRFSGKPIPYTTKENYTERMDRKHEGKREREKRGTIG